MTISKPISHMGEIISHSPLAMPLRGRSGGLRPEPVPVSALSGACHYRIGEAL